MSSSDLAISIRGLSKAYQITHNALRRPTFRDVVMDRLRHPLRRAERETLWALQDVSFDVKRGEVLGVIGRNGAGKSTLLKILSRITEPTAGEVRLYGRVGSLLEVGTGFHPELTGRENIYLNGAILGMTRPEIRKHFDAVVDFSEIEKFLDTPVKRYSSGMYVRLAFAVAAHLEGEILIVDEVLSVGDSGFQQKCLGKMGEVTAQGRTVLFVSHNLGAVGSLCKSALLLDRGRVAAVGYVEDVLTRYLGANGRHAAVVEFAPSTRKPASIRRMWLCDASGRQINAVGCSSAFGVGILVECEADLSGCEVSMRFENSLGQPVFTSNMTNSEEPFRPLRGGQNEYVVRVPGGFLAADTYHVSAAIHRPNVCTYDVQGQALTFAVEELGSNMYQYHGVRCGSVLVSFPWRSNGGCGRDGGSLQ